MCGFTGLINFSSDNNASLSVLKEMNASITHRGPDEEEYYINKNIGLGFRRLSIIDLKQGKQPMSDVTQKFGLFLMVRYTILKN